MRADVFLFKSGLATSRSSAETLINNGVLYKGKPIKKSTDIPDDAATEDFLITSRGEFVSRGGIKLKSALNAFSIDVTLFTAIDIGASTGGFTDCLLSRGAKKVFAVDVGYGQLAKKLKNDSRVISIENFNARALSTDITNGEKADIVTVDVSFISQSYIYERIYDVLNDDGIFVSLIKPQFEVGRENVGRGGIVKNKEEHFSAIKHLLEKAEALSLFAHGIIKSPITGGDGNTEYLVCFYKNKPFILNDKVICDCVYS